MALDLWSGEETRLQEGGEQPILEEVECGNLRFSTSGSLLVPVTKDKMEFSETQKFKENNGYQRVEYFGAPPIRDVLETELPGSSTLTQSGLEVELTQVSQEEVEINAVV